MAGLVLFALLIAGCGRGPATSPASTENAGSTGQVVSDQAPTGDANAQPDGSPSNAAGTAYQVVPEQSEVSYAVGETFLGQRRDVTAVGRTAAISGAIILDEGVIQPSTVEVDLTTLKSDQARRDNQVQRALDTRNHPRAIYRIDGAEGDPVLADGREVPVKLTGTMTIKGTDRRLTFEGTARLEGDTLILMVSTTFNMTDFGVDPPNIANFVAVEEEVKLEVTFTGQKQG